MKKGYLYVLAIIISVGLLFWFLYRSLWLERLINFGRMPVQGKTWQDEVEKAENLYPETLADCYFLGDSHMEQCEWHELFPESRCANRGIGGETTAGLLKRLHTLPSNGMGRFVFLQTGINDLISGDEPEIVLQRYGQILDALSSRNFRIVPSLVFPVRYLDQVNAKVPVLNSGISQLALARKLSLINLNNAISEQNRLSAQFSSDGIHLNHLGYNLWASEIRKFTYRRLPGFGSR